MIEYGPGKLPVPQPSEAPDIPGDMLAFAQRLSLLAFEPVSSLGNLPTTDQYTGQTREVFAHPGVKWRWSGTAWRGWGVFYASTPSELNDLAPYAAQGALGFLASDGSSFSGALFTMIAGRWRQPTNVRLTNGMTSANAFRSYLNLGVNTNLALDQGADAHDANTGDRYWYDADLGGWRYVPRLGNQVDADLIGGTQTAFSGGTIATKTFPSLPYSTTVMLDCDASVGAGGGTAVSSIAFTASAGTLTQSAVGAVRSETGARTTVIQKAKLVLPANTSSVVNAVLTNTGSVNLSAAMAYRRYTS